MAILKYKDKDGNFVVLPTGGGSSVPPTAENVSYDNSLSGLKAEDTQAAIDELSENVIDYSLDETGTGLTIEGGFITQLTANNNCILINKTTSKASSVENLKDENNNIYNFNDFDFLILTMHSSYSGNGGSWEMEPALITPEFFQMKKNIGLSYNNGTSRSVIVSYIDDTHIGFVDTYTGFEEFYVYGIILKNKTFGINKKQHQYSTDEQIVGTWIDGKPLYEKTFTGISNELNAYNNVRYTHIVLNNNCDNIISYKGFIILNNSKKGLPLSEGNWNCVPSILASYVQITEDNTLDLYIAINHDNYLETTIPYQVVVQYTKTTD